ncbi:MAG: hypothetical protein Q7T49_01050 [bacterium]|nr:hypothetical protein [bacterium]
MEKDFTNWFQNKKKIDAEEKPPFYHEREVWWCALGVNFIIIWVRSREWKLALSYLKLD